MVLIDRGGTNNFIDQNTVSRFGLSIIRDKKLQVVVANRERTNAQANIKGSRSLSKEYLSLLTIMFFLWQLAK